MSNPEQAQQTEAAPEVEVERRDQSPENQFRRTIYSVPVNVTVSLGQKRMSVSQVLALQPDAVIPLSSKIDDPIDLVVDDKVIARGDLVETEDGALAIKITEI